MTQLDTSALPCSLAQGAKLLNGDRPIIFFDGDCVMCNWFVDLMIRLDPEATIRLSPLQGDTAQQLLPPLPAQAEEWTIYYLDESGLYDRSEAVVRICQRLNSWVSIFSIAAGLPLVFRDRVYNLIARNRYNLFGKRDSCRVPTPSEQDRFLP